MCLAKGFVFDVFSYLKCGYESPIYSTRYLKLNGSHNYIVNFE